MAFAHFSRSFGKFDCMDSGATKGDLAVNPKFAPNLEGSG
jgi:hypothetical protein